MAQFLTQTPNQADHLVHYLWAINGYARYRWFVEKDELGSRNLIFLGMAKSELLSRFSYDRFDREVKLFPLILALNVARLSCYSKKFEIAKAQFRDLSAFLDGSEMSLQSFPEEIRRSWHPSELGNLLSANIRRYFQGKISAGEKTLAALRRQDA